MMETVLSWTGGVLIVLSVLYMVYLWAVCISARRCNRRRGGGPCHERGCKHAEHCEAYVHRYTAAELAELRRMADEMATR